MGRRRKKYKASDAEEVFVTLVEISSFLPYWITLPGAVVLFFLFSANPPVATATNFPEDVVAMILSLFFWAFFKYFLPGAMVIGGFLNVSKKIESLFLFKSISHQGTRKTLENLTWRDFEFLISEWFKKQGYQTTQLGGNGADGGVDVELRKDGSLYLVQCKHYKDWRVSVKVVRELLGVMTARNAIGGYIVTSGRFTRSAKEFAATTNVQLIDGERLSQLLDDATVVPVKTVVHSCPKCGSELVKRVGSRGEFWGCSSFPKCRFTNAIEN